MPHKDRAFSKMLHRLNAAFSCSSAVDVIDCWWNSFKRKRTAAGRNKSRPKSRWDIASYYETDYRRSKARLADWFLVAARPCLPAPKAAFWSPGFAWCKWPGLVDWSPDEMGLRSCIYRIFLRRLKPVIIERPTSLPSPLFSPEGGGGWMTCWKESQTSSNSLY